MAKKNNNLNPNQFIPSCASYEEGLDLAAYAAAVNAEWDDTFSILLEEVQELGGNITPVSDDGEFFLVLSGLDKKSPEFKAAQYTCGLLEDLHNSIARMYKDAKRSIATMTGTVPSDMLAARGVYRRSRDLYAGGSYQVECKKTEKNPEGLKTVTAKRGLATVYAEWLSAISADKVTEKQAAKLAARLMEVTNFGRVNKVAGSHKFKELGARGVAQDAVNGLLGYLYNGAYGYQLDDKGNPVKDANGQFIQTVYGGKWELKKSFDQTRFCVLTKNAKGEEVNEECGGTLIPEGYEIVRKQA